MYNAFELYTSASGAIRRVYAVYRYTAGIHQDFSTAQNTAFGLATTAETMVGNAECDAEWVPMTPHASQIVRDTQEQLCQAQAHTYIAVWPPSSLMADPLRPDW